MIFLKSIVFVELYLFRYFFKIENIFNFVVAYSHIMPDIFQITHVSFKQLFEKQFLPLCHFLSYYTTNCMVIEEVVQDVFVKLWEDRNVLQIKSVNAYLYTSARNRMINYLRDEKRRNTLLEQWVQFEIEKEHGEECFNIDEFTQRIHDAVDALPEKCRVIFELSTKEKLTYKKIAEHLDLSVKTVENQMGIALRKLRNNLSKFYPRIGDILFFFLKLKKSLSF